MNIKWIVLLALGLGSAVLLTLLARVPKAAESLASQGAKGENKMTLIDDFKSKTASGFPDSEWRFVADTVMGGNSSGSMERATALGVSFLRVTGDVVADNGAGFLLADLDLSKEGKPFVASDYGGIRLALKGNRQSYAVHLKTLDCEQPWQYFSANFDTNGTWQVATLPFKSFKAKGLEAPLDLSRITRISFVGADRPFQVDLSVSRVSFYKGGGGERRELSPEEKAIIENRGTEVAFTGKFLKHNEKGDYTCGRCGAALFESSDKFESHCGWPSFDDSIEGAVLRFPDADGRRVEIVCAFCGGHLGHVFHGENLTEKNTRYCVNSLSIGFDSVAARETAVFASGCFWGTEYFFEKAPGVLETTTGYIGGDKKKPTYEEVCSDQTGHAEAVQVVFDPTKTSYEALARLFFETHDFTQVNRQGPDIGSQYRTEIFYQSEAQKKTAEMLIEKLAKKGSKVATKLTRAGTFWPAEDYHQDYYEKNGKKPYCHFYREVF